MNRALSRGSKMVLKIQRFYQALERWNFNSSGAFLSSLTLSTDFCTQPALCYYIITEDEGGERYEHILWILCCHRERREDRGNRTVEGSHTSAAGDSVAHVARLPVSFSFFVMRNRKELNQCVRFHDLIFPVVSRRELRVIKQLLNSVFAPAGHLLNILNCVEPGLTRDIYLGEKLSLVPLVLIIRCTSISIVKP